MQDSVKAKKEAKKLWDSTRDEVTKEKYKRARKGGETRTVPKIGDEGRRNGTVQDSQTEG